MLVVNGSSGQPGQVLQSNGGVSSPSWTNKPSVLYFNQSSDIVLGGSDLCINIPNVNNQNFTLPQNSWITYQFTIPLYGENGSLGGNSFGIVSIQVLDGSSNVVSAGASSYSVPNYQETNIVVIGVGDLSAGSYTIRARVGRNSGDGVTRSNFGTVGCGIAMHTGQLIMQIFPK